MPSVNAISWARCVRFALPFAALLGGCTTPPRIGMPDASIIRLHDGGALPPDCAPLVDRSNFRDAGRRRPSVAFGCATYTNLAAMLVRPADLTDPLPFDGADPVLTGNAVRGYESGKITPLQSTSTSTVEQSTNGNK